MMKDAEEAAKDATCRATYATNHYNAKVQHAVQYSALDEACNETWYAILDVGGAGATYDAVRGAVRGNDNQMIKYAEAFYLGKIMEIKEIKEQSD